MSTSDGLYTIVYNGEVYTFTNCNSEFVEFEFGQRL